MFKPTIWNSKINFSFMSIYVDQTGTKRKSLPRAWIWCGKSVHQGHLVQCHFWKTLSKRGTFPSMFVEYLITDYKFQKCRTDLLVVQLKWFVYIFKGRLWLDWKQHRSTTSLWIAKTFGPITHPQGWGNWFKWESNNIRDGMSNLYSHIRLSRITQPGDHGICD